MANKIHRAIADYALYDPGFDQELYPKALCTEKENTVYLKLDASQGISYTVAVDETVGRLGINGDLTKKIRILFRRFKLHDIDLAGLTHKITSTTVSYAPEIQAVIQGNKQKAALAIKLREVLQRQDFQAKYNYRVDPIKLEQKIAKIIRVTFENELILDDETQDDINTQAAELFKAGIQATHQARDEEVVFLVGITGSGKSTTTNFLMGCEMHRVDKKVLGIESLSPNLILAKNPVARIGHKDTSKTSYPTVVKGSEKLAYCDTPGMRGTQGKATEIYNALCIKEIIDQCEIVKGFLFLIERSNLEGGRNQGILENIEFLFRLLKGDFVRHQRAILFVVTKADSKELEAVKSALKSAVSKIIADKSQPLALRKFTKQIFDSNILNEKVVICDPCGKTWLLNRQTILEHIERFTYDIHTKDYGYPISEKVEAKLEQTRTSFIFHAQNTLRLLQIKLREYYLGKTEKTDVEETKKYLDEVTALFTEFQEELSHFTSEKYKVISATVVDELKKCLTYWEKINDISDSKKPKIEHLEHLFESLKKELGSLVQILEKRYYDRMFEVIKTSLEAKLGTYCIQDKLPELSKNLSAADLDKKTAAELTELVGALVKESKTEALKYADHLETVLSKEKSRVLELRNLIRNTILEPFHFDGIIVQPTAKRFTLNEVLRRVKDSMEKLQYLKIICSFESGDGTLYFNADLAEYKGKNIFIQADRIEVKGNPSVDLGFSMFLGGALAIKGKLVGTCEIRDKQFILHEKDETQEFKIIRCQWPL